MAPIPTAEHKRDDMPGRQNITPEVVESLKPGISRLQVLQQLGTPDGVFEQDRTFVYLWSNCTGYFTWFIYTGTVAGGSAGAMPVGKGYALIIDFDDQGRLLRQQTLAANNWGQWTGPMIEGTVFPHALRDPTSLSARSPEKN